MSGSYLFDNAILDRNAKLATGHEVDSEADFAERLLLLAKFPPTGTIDEADSFLDRVAAWRRSDAES
jgi:hypothetical protein